MNPKSRNPSRATTDSTPSKKVDRVGRGRNERNDLSSTSEFIGFFPAGLQNVIESVLEANSAKLLDIDQSAVRFSHQDSPPTQLIPLFKNVFSIEASTTRGPLPHSVSRLTAQLAKRGIAGIRKDDTFRIMAHIDGQLTSIDRARRTTLEIMIESLTGTRVRSRGEGMEYWIIGRKGWKNLFFGTRLRTPATPAPNKGELAPNLASLLITLSEPRPDEDFIDPFAGSGGIVQQRLKWPAARVHFNDLKTHAPRNLMRTGRVSTSSWDTRRPPVSFHGCFSTIVTDPPWGEYMDIGGDYRQWAEEATTGMMRLLRTEGSTIVLLSNRANENMWVASINESPLHVENRIPLLINGHPASAIVARY